MTQSQAHNNTFLHEVLSLPKLDFRGEQNNVVWVRAECLTCFQTSFCFLIFISCVSGPKYQPHLESADPTLPDPIAHFECGVDTDLQDGKVSLLSYLDIGP